ncbi:MAG TPA: GntR family transcriptional regulator [Microbacterium sp.]|nr:GntR family transcriptional regulator [Microbacterium sp.]
MGAMETALYGLRALIADGDLKPGARLPSEGELCERLGVSRGPLREAIRTLSALGVIDTRHGSGSYVSELHAADLIRGLSLTVGLLPLESIIELYELRRALEAHAASLAAARIDDETIVRLDHLLTRLESVTDDEGQSELDNEFHSAIAQVAGNDALATLLDVLRARSRAYRIFSTEDAAEIKILSDAGHRAIFRGLASRDPVASSAAAAGHVAQTEFWLRKHQPPATS